MPLHMALRGGQEVWPEAISSMFRSKGETIEGHGSDVLGDSGLLNFHTELQMEASRHPPAATAALQDTRRTVVESLHLLASGHHPVSVQPPPLNMGRAKPCLQSCWRSPDRRGRAWLRWFPQ